MEEKNKEIFFVLTYSGTPLAKVIKCYTGAEFSHVSLALDKNLEQMYSFGRVNPYNPFIGGLVHEGINIGTFKRFSNTYAAVYSYKVTNEQYNKIKEIVYKMYDNKRKYKFNVLGLFANGFHISIKRKNYFYCAEFIKHVVEKAEVDLNLPTLVRPNDFKKIKTLDLRYRGKLNRYPVGD